MEEVRWDIDGSDDEDEEDYISWVSWFTEMKGNEFFCVVDREYIEDDFNLIGLSSLVGSSYHYALDLILDMSSPKSDHLTEEQQRMVESSAETLYGLIHSRFITTQRGLQLMVDKFLHSEFGTCPRVLCAEQAVLPVGMSDELQESSVKLFCPKCQDVYHPRSTRYKALDGAFWGTSFPHLLLLQLREQGFPASFVQRTYVPRIYGFRIHRPAAAADAEQSGEGSRHDGADLNNHVGKGEAA